MLKSLFRPFVVRFLRSTARGPLVQALPSERAPSALSRLLNGIFKTLGRAVGLVLTPRIKSQIQEWLINTFRVPVDWQPREKLQSRFVEVLKELSNGDDELGDYLEFGVYQGNSLICMSRASEQLGLNQMRLFGFDSFAGLPDSADFDRIWSPGQFRSDESFTRDLLTRAGISWDRTQLIKGFYDAVLTPELASRLELRKASVIMIDCDLYSSTRDALAFCAPLITDRTVIFFDDWQATDESHGEKLAFREWLEAHPDLQAQELPGYHDASKVFSITRGS